MRSPPNLGRRSVLGAVVACAATAAAGATRAQSLTEFDRPGLELVMQLVVTCSDPEPVAATANSKDGQRSEIWPIVGGRFSGPGIRGEVIPGGGDFPVRRPDGVEVIDALYRLRTDDGAQIIIHNYGLYYPAAGGLPERFRLAPEFIAPVGKYDWLNRSLFLSTLVEVPPALALAGPGQNDRMIEIYRVT